MFLMIRPLGQAFGAYSSVMSALGALARIEEILVLPLEETAKESAQVSPPTPITTMKAAFDATPAIGEIKALIFAIFTPWI